MEELSMFCGGRGKEDRSGQRGEDLVRKMMEKREVCPVGVGFGGMVGSVFFFLSWRAAVLVEGDEGND
jgi:hypothetical protein